MNEGIKQLRIEIKKKIIDSGLLGIETDSEISRRFGLSITTIGDLRKQLGIPVRCSGRLCKPRNCPHCGCDVSAFFGPKYTLTKKRLADCDEMRKRKAGQ